MPDRVTTAHPVRLLALAYVGDPPFEGAEAYFTPRNDGDSPNAANVAWRSAQERWREVAPNLSATERSVRHVNISNDVSGGLSDQFAEQWREHGATYVIDCVGKGFPIVGLVASRHFRTPVMPFYWQRLIADNPGSDSAAETDS